jgi:FtsP/CotA-like multicopper oxidase with cupredoxin domain
VLGHQTFNATAFEAAWRAGQNPDIGNYLSGSFSQPFAQDTGWKDTTRALGKEVLFIAAKFDLPAGPAVLPPGHNDPEYVLHCHFLEHEDNEMMRPFHVTPASGAPPSGNPDGEPYHWRKPRYVPGAWRKR